MSLGEISQTIIEEALELVNTNKHCYDNVTLIIVSLSDYWKDFQLEMKQSLLCQELQIRRQ